MRDDAREAGFSLVETLVSLAVITAMAATLFEAVGMNARATQTLGRKREAIQLARSLLAQAMIAPGPGELPESGQWQNLSWHFHSHPIEGGARDSGMRLEEIRINVADRASGRRLVGVRTLRLDR